jgi:hypothetical protein
MEGRQCREGLFFADQNVWSDSVSEYRCELNQGHESEWHMDGVTRWKTY